MSVEGRAFLKLLRDEVSAAVPSLPDLKGTWESSARWTEFMLGSPSTRAGGRFGVLGQVGRSVGYQIQAEYLRVDQIWYDSPPSSPDDWLIEAFVEHENDVRRVPETIRKILQLGPGLKVLVTYPESVPAETLVTRVSELIRKRYGTPPDSRLLLVLGRLASPLPLWRAHEFDGLGRESGMPEGNVA